MLQIRLTRPVFNLPRRHHPFLHHLHRMVHTGTQETGPQDVMPPHDLLPRGLKTFYIQTAPQAAVPLIKARIHLGGGGSVEQFLNGRERPDVRNFTRPGNHRLQLLSREFDQREISRFLFHGCSQGRPGDDFPQRLLHAGDQGLHPGRIVMMSTEFPDERKLLL